MCIRPFFLCRPWKRPRQRPLCLPCPPPLFSGRTKPGRSQPPGRTERFTVWIIRPQNPCGPFASISWTGHPAPYGFSGLSGEKIPTGPRAGTALHKRQLRPETAPSESQGCLGQASSLAAARYLLPRPGSWVLEGSPGTFLLVHAASPSPRFLRLQALWLNHIRRPRGSRSPKTGETEEGSPPPPGCVSS